MKNDIAIITICNNAILGPPNMNPEIIGGVVHGTITPVNNGTNPDAIAK